jgi:hypothetical protein
MIIQPDDPSLMAHGEAVKLVKHSDRTPLRHTVGYGRLQRRYCRACAISATNRRGTQPARRSNAQNTPCSQIPIITRPTGGPPPCNRLLTVNDFAGPCFKAGRLLQCVTCSILPAGGATTVVLGRSRSRDPALVHSPLLVSRPTSVLEDC